MKVFSTSRAIYFCQKAPSAKRCIKTTPSRVLARYSGRARKHRAPNGALRLGGIDLSGLQRGRQKAPSAKRCIKTRGSRTLNGSSVRVRKHRAPKGTLRQSSPDHRCKRVALCQKAPSATRRIRTAACTAVYPINPAEIVRKY